jgi:Family of unknown function (DUF6266)
MAILTQGILGKVVGKTGPVVSYMRFGQNISRSKGSTRKNRIETPARKTQREKIKVCNDFTRAFSGTGFFNKSFPAYGHTGSGYNRVTSSIMNLAIVQAPAIAIAWPKVLISKGPVAPVDYASALVNDEGNIAFTWTDNSGDGTAKKNDIAIMVAYFPEEKKAFYTFSDAERKDEKAVLDVESQKGMAQTWLGFLSADEMNSANSVYCGEVIV